MAHTLVFMFCRKALAVNKFFRLVQGSVHLISFLCFSLRYQSATLTTPDILQQQQQLQQLQPQQQHEPEHQHPPSAQSHVRGWERCRPAALGPQSKWNQSRSDPSCRRRHQQRDRRRRRRSAGTRGDFLHSEEGSRRRHGGPEEKVEWRGRRAGGGWEGKNGRPTRKSFHPPIR